MQLQKKVMVEDPPCRVQLVAFVMSYNEPFLKLQSDFQCISGRIGQVPPPPPHTHIHGPHGHTCKVMLRA